MGCIALFYFVDLYRFNDGLVAGFTMMLIASFVLSGNKEKREILFIMFQIYAYNVFRIFNIFLRKRIKADLGTPEYIKSNKQFGLTSYYISIYVT